MQVAKKPHGHNAGIPVSEGARRATEETGIPAAEKISSRSDSQVPVHQTRRRLTTAFKLKVLQKVSELKANGNGTVGAYLRENGLYYATISNWQKQIDKGILGQVKKPLGKSEKSRQSLMSENKKLRRKMQQLEKKLHKTELLVELQKKISQMMELDDETSV